MSKTEKKREAAELRGKLDQKLGRLAAASDHLDSVRLRMRQSVPPGLRDDVFDREITGITEIPAGFPNGHA